MKIHKYAVDEYGFEHWRFVCSSSIIYLKLEGTSNWQKVTCKNCLKKRKRLNNSEDEIARKDSLLREREKEIEIYREALEKIRTMPTDKSVFRVNYNEIYWNIVRLCQLALESARKVL